MVTFLVVLILFIAILLTLVVLAQNSKGGGLTDASGASQVIGAQRSTDWIEKATWVLSIAMFALCLLVNVFIEPTTANAGASSPNIERAKQSPAATIAPTPSTGEEGTEALTPTETTEDTNGEGGLFEEEISGEESEGN